jgi:hypothetical protein
MKVSIELDLTPKEARELMGFDNVDKLQQFFIKSLAGAAEVEDSPLLAMYQTFLKQGQEAMENYRKAVDPAEAMAAKSKAKAAAR